MFKTGNPLSRLSRWSAEIFKGKSEEPAQVEETVDPLVEKMDALFVKVEAADGIDDENREEAMETIALFREQFDGDISDFGYLFNCVRSLVGETNMGDLLLGGGPVSKKAQLLSYCFKILGDPKMAPVNDEEVFVPVG